MKQCGMGEKQETRGTNPAPDAYFLGTGLHSFVSSVGLPARLVCLGGRFSGQALWLTTGDKETPTERWSFSSSSSSVEFGLEFGRLNTRATHEYSVRL